MHRQQLPADLLAALSAAACRLAPLAADVRFFDEVPSTNDVAAVAADRGAPEGTVVIANSQTAGRGRQGRHWHSPAGAGLYVSIVLRPRPHAAGLITIAAGVALSHGIRFATGVSTALKWPNDVMVMEGGPRKLAGILAEGGRDESFGARVVLGFGINLEPASYPPDVAARATSLQEHASGPVVRGEVLVECLAALAARYDGLQRNETADLLQTWRALARPMLGRRVEWTAGATMTGMAIDVDDAGALLVRTDEGVERVVGGEVRWT